MNQQLNEAKQLFQQGNFDAVVTLCRQYTDKHPMFALLLASALGKCGEFEEAHQWFENLKKRFVANPDIPFNQALVYREAGDTQQAITLLNRTLAIQQDYHPAWFALGNAYVAQGQLQAAIKPFEQALLRQPQHMPYRLGLAQALLENGQAEHVINLLYPFDADNDELVVLELGLLAYYRTENRDQACRLYERAFAANKKSFTLCYYAALNDIEEKRYYRAKEFLETAQAFDVPASEGLAVELNIAFCEFMLDGEITHLSRFTKTIGDASARDQLFLAQLFESLGRYAQCDALLDQVEPILPEDKQKCMWLRAKSALAAGEVTVAESCLDNDEYSSTVSTDYLRVAIAEKQQDFSKAASLLRTIGEAAPQPNAFVTQFAEEVAAARSRQQGNKQCQDARVEMPGMVFIVGFPRSGTTLLEQKLSAYAGAVVLEETTLIPSLFRRIAERAGEQDVIAWLDGQSEDALASLRHEFLQQVSHYCGPLSEDAWLLDKMPFNCLYVPLITSLFPHAKIIWAHRHPKDIFVSCLKQEEIRIYSDSDFTGAFSAYLSVYDTFSQLPESQLMQVRYETFVADTDAWMHRLVTWADLPDSSDNGSRERMIITPSYEQVSQQVYQSSVNKFAHYSTQLPALDSEKIASFASRLGYQR